jgi:hypothetical protein
MKEMRVTKMVSLFIRSTSFFLISICNPQFAIGFASFFSLPVADRLPPLSLPTGRQAQWERVGVRGVVLILKTTGKQFGSKKFYKAKDFFQV